jgi:hypothetical protein
MTAVLWLTHTTPDAAVQVSAMLGSREQKLQELAAGLNKATVSKWLCGAAQSDCTVQHIQTPFSCSKQVCSKSAATFNMLLSWMAA